jgi:hypothetical protein
MMWRLCNARHATSRSTQAPCCTYTVFASAASAACTARYPSGLVSLQQISARGRMAPNRHAQPRRPVGRRGHSAIGVHQPGKQILDAALHGGVVVIGPFQLPYTCGCGTDGSRGTFVGQEYPCWCEGRSVDRGKVGEAHQVPTPRRRCLPHRSFPP